MTKKPAKTATDFPPEVLSAFDQYVHGVIDRRQFLRRASIVTAVTMLARRKNWRRSITPCTY